ncbi:uncharacterized protein LOC134839575 isoform X2 [Symsagittifera roscoffensis]
MFPHSPNNSIVSIDPENPGRVTTTSPDPEAKFNEYYINSPIQVSNQRATGIPNTVQIPDATSQFASQTSISDQNEALGNEKTDFLTLQNFKPKTRSQSPLRGSALAIRKRSNTSNSKQTIGSRNIATSDSNALSISNSSYVKNSKGKKEIARQNTDQFKTTIPIQRMLKGGHSKEAQQQMKTIHDSDQQTDFDHETPSQKPVSMNQKLNWEEAIASADSVFYWSRKAMYDPKKRSFTLSYERPNPRQKEAASVDPTSSLWMSAAVPNLRLNKRLKLVGPVCSVGNTGRLHMCTRGTVSSKSVEPQYKSVLPQMLNAADDPTLKSNWAVNFADPAVLDPDTGLDFPVRQLREAPVHEPQVRPSTKMSPRLRSRVITANQISEHRSKSAFLPTLDADHKENRNQLPRKNLKSATASTQTTPLRPNQTSINLPITASQTADTVTVFNRDGSYCGIVHAVQNMQKSMPKPRQLTTPRSVKTKHIGMSNTKQSYVDAAGRADQLFPRRPTTTHQQILKDLYVTQSIFEKDKTQSFSPMRHYFTT